MKVDDTREFNVMSEKSFSLRNQKFTLNASEKALYDECKDLKMRDQKAIDLSRFLSRFQSQISLQNSWNQNEILILIREVLAEKASSAKEEKDLLEQ